MDLRTFKMKGQGPRRATSEGPRPKIVKIKNASVYPLHVMSPLHFSASRGRYSLRVAASVSKLLLMGGVNVD